MITCKEDLINTYIKNDFGELRDLYIKKAIELGVKTCDGGRYEYLLNKVNIGVSDWGYGAQLEWNAREFSDAKRLTLSDLKPRTKIEYEKVTESVNEIAKRMIDGEVFYNHDGSDKFDWKLNGFGKNGLALTGLNGFDFYRKVEKEIDWREEVITFVKQNNANSGNFNVGYECEEKFLTDEQFLEMCRVALRATGELK